MGNRRKEPLSIAGDHRPQDGVGDVVGREGSADGGAGAANGSAVAGQTVLVEIGGHE